MEECRTNERRNYRVDVVCFNGVSAVRVKEITSKRVWLTQAVFLTEKQMMCVADGSSLKVYHGNEEPQKVTKMKVYGTRIHEKVDSYESVIFDTAQHFHLAQCAVA